MLKKFNKLFDNIISEESWAGGEAAFPEMIKQVSLDEFPELTVKCSFDPERGMTTVTIWKDKKIIGSKCARNVLDETGLKQLAYEIIEIKGYVSSPEVGGKKADYSVQDLVMDIEKNPNYIVKWMPYYNYWRVKYAPGIFGKNFDRSKTNPGWAMFNDFKKIWQANTDESYDRVNIGVYSLYVTIKP